MHAQSVLIQHASCLGPRDGPGTFHSAARDVARLIEIISASGSNAELNARAVPTRMRVTASAYAHEGHSFCLLDGLLEPKL